MKTNLDTIDRATMAEVFAANCTVCKEVRNSDSCLGLDSSEPCHKSMLKWLKQVIKPMPKLPKLQVGDIITYNTEVEECLAVCVFDDIVYLFGENRCCKFDDIVKKTRAIDRFELAKRNIVEIWRAENSDR